ncbi:MAG: chemotaxis response regulator protein-glutamate methylesterase [Thiomicrorhabdus sp.]|nr:chemotaxis response regulator protein-glutamate methylesterase [Thiomicrorhabdus sp.]
MLEEMLSADPEIDVVGTAFDPFDAREKIKALHPDVLTLDVEMPKMDGVTFLRNLMRLHPMPVVMVSTLTEKGADVTFEAMDLGAVDFVTKPKINLANTFEAYTQEICRKIKTASKVSKASLERQYNRYTANLKAPPVLAKAVPRNVGNATTRTSVRSSNKVIALGASTGGTEAIKEVLMRLPASTPAIVITQHIPATFSLPFAKRMNTVSEMTVYHAKDGQPILSGNVYIAPGDKHLMVVKEGGGYVCRLNDGPPVNRHKPAVDVMFRSVTDTVGANAICVLLTGMGADGAVGMKEMQAKKAPTIAQDENSSVVWGMPGEAVKLGAADYVLSLNDIPQKILELV